jgi:hypothetical protein
VGLPLESRICLAFTSTISVMSSSSALRLLLSEGLASWHVV